MNILLLGGSGQLGFELKRELSTLGVVKAPDRDSLDLSDLMAVEQYLQTMRPDLIVNAAAWTAVDAAENNEILAQRLNADLPEVLSIYAVNKNVRLVHYSSDYVYPGNGEIAWTEKSKTSPLNVYGRTKLAGDKAIILSGVDYLIFRTSWVYSSRGHNFMKTMLKLAETRTEVSVVSDQVGAPTPARLLAQVTMLAIHQNLEAGIYHLVTHGQISWAGFAQAIFKHARQNIVVNEIKTDAYPTPAKRPLNSRLNVNKLEDSLKIKLPDWESQLVLTMNEFLEQP
ncbi:dTDP-4-dehydrorhamnose reductase [Methylophaga sp. OBS3]|uniref:dTDP-4-dehydrorhamnose reductase n=1 Tax=Methylophaga sp. OBS3 TaxID=2991934 RepID=UPI00224E7FF5|nr:dTDP-4-dehydrorhamnose reductase [Methylophaga sp. OBS3]MCX4190260.1 dTDP-4-dehydrorhamnose reductase [Methylophaga sp. OBS3]